MFVLSPQATENMGAVYSALKQWGKAALWYGAPLLAPTSSPPSHTHTPHPSGVLGRHHPASVYTTVIVILASIRASRCHA